MISKNIIALFLFLSIGFFQFTAAQVPYSATQIPDPKANGGTGYVSNPDQVLSSNEVDQLNDVIKTLEKKTKVEVAVVVVRSFDASDEDFEFAMKLFNPWGIGKARANNGLLLFIAVDRKKYRFITGYGLEGILPDLRLSRIAGRYLVPSFREEKYGEGIVNTMNTISDYLNDPGNQKELDQLLVKKTNLFKDQLVTYFVIVLLFAASVFGLKKQTPKVKSSKGEIQNIYERIVAAGCLSLVLLCCLPLFFIALFFGIDWAKHIRYETYAYVLYGFLAIILFFRYLSALAAIRRVNYDDKNFIQAVKVFNRTGLLYVISSPLILLVIIIETIHRIKGAARFKPVPDRQNKEMIRVDRDVNRSGKPFLNDGQVTEEKLEVFHYDIWLSTDEKEYKVLPYRAINYKRYDNCPHCTIKTFSGKMKITILKPTYSKEGEGKEIRKCENCGYEELLKTFVIPVKTRESSNSGSSSSGGGSSSSSSSDSSSWGGGSSGGGGAGGSW